MIQVEPDTSNADRMKVTIAIDNYYDGGPFGGLPFTAAASGWCWSC